MFQWKIGIFIPKNELVVEKTKNIINDQALWGKTDNKNANTILKIENPTGIFLQNGLESILIEYLLPDQKIHIEKLEKYLVKP